MHSTSPEKLLGGCRFFTGENIHLYKNFGFQRKILGCLYQNCILPVQRIVENVDIETICGRNFKHDEFFSPSQQ